MSDLLVEVRDGVGGLTLNRPEARNAMPSSLYRTFGEVLRDFEQDPDVRVVLISGVGPHFSAGGA